MVADSIGGPSLRTGDNIIQAAIVLGSMLVGGLIGLSFWGGMGGIIGTVGAMIISTLLSGLVLMVLG